MDFEEDWALFLPNKPKRELPSLVTLPRGVRIGEKVVDIFLWQSIFKENDKYAHITALSVYTLSVSGVRSFFEALNDSYNPDKPFRLPTGLELAELNLLLGHSDPTFRDPLELVAKEDPIDYSQRISCFRIAQDAP